MKNKNNINTSKLEIPPFFLATLLDQEEMLYTQIRNSNCVKRPQDDSIKAEEKSSASINGFEK